MPGGSDNYLSRPRFAYREGHAHGHARIATTPDVSCGVVAATLSTSFHARAQASGPAAAPRISVGPNLRLIPGQHNEMWVAVSPTNPNVMIAVAQQQSGDELGVGGRNASTMVSRDGGNTWTTVRLPGYTAGAFDPMVVVGPGGRFYVMQCVIGGSFARALSGPEASQAASIRVWTTTGDAWTWDGPTEIRPSVQPDHARLVVDMTQRAAPRARVPRLERCLRLLRARPVRDVPPVLR